MYDLHRHFALRSALLAALDELPESAAEAGFVQIGLDVAPLDLITWLQSQSGDELQWFWTSRKRAFQVAALGAVASWDSLLDVESALSGLAPELRCYGGWRFNPEGKRVPWQEWPEALFFLPRWELRCEQGAYRLCLNLRGPRNTWAAQLEAALKLISQVQPEAAPAAAPPLGELRHEPGLAGWQAHMAQAKALFAEGRLNKLVLSRHSAAALAELPLSLMQRLLAQGREAYHFWFRPAAGRVLWGASPERLYARSGDTIWTEALAGTRPRPNDPSRQEALRQELLGSHKEFEENERVRQHLEVALAPLTLSLSAEPLRVIPSGPVQHLYRCLQGRLRPGISDASLVELLHPTPAVSGFPSAEARARLGAIETHDRGWYSGALGWISPKAAEWSVTLRCALWQADMIHFYTGAGIMPASEPEAEWQELEVKLASLLALWA